MSDNNVDFYYVCVEMNEWMNEWVNWLALFYSLDSRSCCNWTLWEVLSYGNSRSPFHLLSLWTTCRTNVFPVSASHYFHTFHNLAVVEERISSFSINFTSWRQCPTAGCESRNQDYGQCIHHDCCFNPVPSLTGKGVRSILWIDQSHTANYCSRLWCSTFTTSYFGARLCLWSERGACSGSQKLSHWNHDSIWISDFTIPHYWFGSVSLYFITFL